MAGSPVGKNPLPPRTAWWRIGPRRQGFAPPLRALDCCGPIRGATLFTKGKGVDGPGCQVASGRGDGPKGSLSVISAALSRSRGALSPAGP